MHPATISALSGIFEMMRQALRSAEGILASDAGYRSQNQQGQKSREEQEDPSRMKFLDDAQENALEALIAESMKVDTPEG